MAVAGATMMMLDTMKSIYQKHLETITDPLVKALSEECWGIFNQIGLPEKSWEDWQYVDLINAYENFTNAPTLIMKKNISSQKYFNHSGDQILLENGKLKQARTNQLKVAPITQLNSIEMKSLCQKIKGLIAKEKNPFVLFNYALFSSGVMISVPSDQLCKFLISSECNSSNLVAPFVYIALSENSNAEITYQELHEQKGQEGVSSMVVVEANENSKVELNHLQLDCSSGFNLSHLRYVLKRSACASVQGVYVGSELSRLDSIAEINEEGAAFNYYSLNILKGLNQQHHYVRIRHNAKNGNSNQLFRNALFGKSRVSVDATVEVAIGAKQTDSKQLINNLFLSETAHAFTKPNLRILHEDVKCKHGATSGSLEKDHLFYLKSRGLEESAARVLMLKSFAGEITSQIKDPEVQEFVSKIIFENLLVSDKQ